MPSISALEQKSIEEPSDHAIGPEVKRRRLLTNAPVCAKDIMFDLAEINIRDPIQSKVRSNFRWSKIEKSVPGDDKAFRIQLTYPGNIPFEVDNKNDNGSVSINIEILDKEELTALQTFSDELVSYAQSVKEKWWPNQMISDEDVKRQFKSIVKHDQKKDSDEYWLPKIKVNLPMDKSKTKMDTSKCKIIDSDQQQIDYTCLRKGQKVARVMFEASNLYFVHQAWGVKLNLFKMDMEPSEDMPTPDDIPYNS